MTAKAGLDRGTALTAKGRARFCVGRVGVHCTDRFLASRRASGEILLTPLTSIPKRELLTWENDELRASLLRGLDDVAAGRVGPLDDLV